MKGILVFTILTLIFLTGVSAVASGISIEFPRDGPWPTAFVDSDGDGRTDIVMEIDPWNIERASGLQRMTYDPVSGSIEFFSNLTNEVLKDPASWVHGYPEVYFGNKPWNGNLADGMDVKLPIRVSELRHFTVHLEYSLNAPDESLPLNLAMETWLTKEKHRSNGVFPGEVEIMVWFYYQNIKPAGTKIGETTVPIIVNGTLVKATFEVWLEPDMGDGWQYMAFRTKEPMMRANLTLDPFLFVKAAEKFSEIDFEDLYMEDWEIGTEFGGPWTNKASFGWTIKGLRVAYGRLETGKHERIAERRPSTRQIFSTIILRAGRLTVL